MCDARRRPANGADSEPTFVVHLRSLYDDDDREVVRVCAIDAEAAEREARRRMPGYFSTWVREA